MIIFMKDCGKFLGGIYGLKRVQEFLPKSYIEWIFIKYLLSAKYCLFALKNLEEVVLSWGMGSGMRWGWKEGIEQKDESE